jgi:hypothetical protein
MRTHVLSSMSMLHFSSNPIPSGLKAARERDGKSKFLPDQSRDRYASTYRGKSDKMDWARSSNPNPRKW